MKKVLLSLLVSVMMLSAIPALADDHYIGGYVNPWSINDDSNRWTEAFGRTIIDSFLVQDFKSCTIEVGHNGDSWSVQSYDGGEYTYHINSIEVDEAGTYTLTPLCEDRVGKTTTVEVL